MITITPQTKQLGTANTADGEVYSLEDGTAIKIPRILTHIYGSPALHSPNIAQEYHFAKILFAGGVSVPRPIALERVRMQRANWPKDYESAGFRMEEIEGISGEYIYGTALYQRASNLYQVESNKALELGLVPIDAGVGNSIYDPRQDRLYLIDFAAWTTDAQLLHRIRKDDDWDSLVLDKKFVRRILKEDGSDSLVFNKRNLVSSF